MTGPEEESWRCGGCGEAILLGFTECWKCGTVRSRGGVVEPDSLVAGTARPEERSKAPTPLLALEEPMAPLSTALPDLEKKPWAEVAVVLLVAVLPSFFHSLWGFFRPSPVIPFVEAGSFLIIYSIQVSAPVLFVIARSGQPLSYFGIVRPSWALDCFLAFIVLTLSLGSGTLLRPLFSFWFPGTSEAFSQPSGLGQHLLLVVSQASNGFAEELIMRAYLIPRFETLLGSTGKSIMLTSALFASYHLYQGPAACLEIFIIGLVYGSIFAITRRIWPLALGHASQGILACIY